ncbi:MAG: hypothetical protein ACTH58_05655 [Marinomonas foliarum]|uniref:hypothetical protein n=1 Tax=Marinomonas foliarum TaxID=491950 RepID=UPI003F9B6889
MSRYLVFMVGLLCSPSLVWAANPSINELNSCVALVEFVDSKLDDYAKNYAEEDIRAVHTGLSSYRDYLQEEVITPRILNMYGGNAGQAKLMQTLFDRQKNTFASHLNERYSEKKLFTEYAAAINDCTAYTRIKPEVVKKLNLAITAMIRMQNQ